MAIGAAAARRVKEAGPETALFRRRALVGFAIVLACLAILGGRFVVLQVARHAEFHGRSEDNRIKPRALPPSRGLIYDRAGRLLAENIPQYRLELVPEQVGDVDAAIAGLREVVGIDDDELERFEAERRLRRRFESIPVKLQMSEADVARFAVHRWRFPGVEVVPYLTRYYPEGALLAHVIGYVGRIDEEDRQRLESSRYAGTSHVGKTGIERQYEDLLLGTVGFERVETDVRGRALSTLSRVPPKQGRNLYLTLDLELQRAAAAAFDGQPGSAVAIDPRNGEVLAMVSLPGFDPNLFVNGISRRDYAALLAAPYRPLFNRALQGGYEPGSTMKPFIALAGLELGLRRPQDVVFSGGEFRLPGMPQVWRDWKAGGHGRVDLNEAMAQSVNTYFYQLAVDLGVDRLGGYLSQFGFGAPTGIDLGGEIAGVLPSRAWKRAQLATEWYPGETVIAGIGQGYWVVTPIQLASALATLAGGGVRHAPHVLAATQYGIDAAREPVAVAPARASFVKSAANLDAVRVSMEAVMHGPTGTARAFGADAPWRIAGKSGTAQRFTRRDGGEYDETRVAEHLRHRALFVAWAPAEDPRIAVAVVVEHGNSGSRAAAPVARRIIDAWLTANPP
ncbi:MAG: penicillin-binding protein 2 [Xanthomonadaceae bacterium]|jgi:penicillin-binding protein 2|nr:penicillin-binding protein 2 [Xanthomonadaceae bacterium]